MKLLTLCISILLSSMVMAHPHANDSIVFDYTFQKSETSKNVIEVNLTLTNQSSDWFYFIKNSCNGLDYYITTTSAKATPLILIHCNASTPIKTAIPPGKTFVYALKIQYIGDIDKLGLHLALIQVSKHYRNDEKFISEADIKKKMGTLLLSGPILTLPK